LTSPGLRDVGTELWCVVELLLPAVVELKPTLSNRI
jgi:hypothetical protein